MNINKNNNSLGLDDDDDDDDDAFPTLEDETLPVRLHLCVLSLCCEVALVVCVCARACVDFFLKGMAWHGVVVAASCLVLMLVLVLGVGGVCPLGGSGLDIDDDATCLIRGRDALLSSQRRFWPSLTRRSRFPLGPSTF